MRLRYIHLPHCGPLEDTFIVFGQQKLLYGPDALATPARRGAINFIVGINGTGKSTILRAIYQTFRALKNRRRPPLPITIAWDVTNVGGMKSATALFHLPTSGVDQMAFMGTPPLAPDASLENWQRHTARSLQPEEGVTITPRIVGPDVIGSPALEAHLPSRLIAYTSGADTLWDEIEHHEFWDLEKINGTGYDDGDRPPGWTLEREWEEEQPVRMSNALSRMGIVAGAEMQDLGPQAGSIGAMKPEVAAAFQESIRPMAELSRKVFNNQIRRSLNPSPPVMRVTQADLRTAAVALALRRAAVEGPKLANESEAAAVRKLRIKESQNQQTENSVEWVFDTVDWFQATHLSFTYRDADDRVSKNQTEQLLCLLALAGETSVIEQPLGRVRVVIRLMPEIELNLESKLAAALPNTPLGSGVEAILKRLRGCSSGAEAIVKIFTENEGDAAMNDVFLALRAWRESGLLEDLNLTIQRLHPKSKLSGKPDDAYVTYDLLSDGEQMLLARMALIHLLKSQENSLLLLDEPETHFNDAWKRRLIDLVDDSILKDTSAQVLVSTHTSLALTDVFSCEITRLVKDLGITRAERVVHPTFGADPGRLLLHVFGAPDVIGSRAAEFLRSKLDPAQWPREDREKLRSLIDEIGSGWPRAKLMDILDELDAPQREDLSHAPFDS